MSSAQAVLLGAFAPGVNVGLCLALMLGLAFSFTDSSLILHVAFLVVIAITLFLLLNWTESPIGQFLSQILISHPHLVLAAVEQQLKQLQTEWDTKQKKEELFASGMDLVLYRRIADVKASERKRTLEEIFYALVVQKFMDANVSLVPAITPSSKNSSGQVDTWPSQEEKFEQLHSPEAYEMIQSHLALILGNRLNDSKSSMHCNNYCYFYL